MKRSLVWLVLVAACGGDDGAMGPSPDGGQPTAAQIAEAVDKCHTLVSSFCTRFADCSLMWQAPPPERAERITECKQSAATEIDCGKAIGVTADYSRCLREVNEFSCTVLFPQPWPPADGSLPASCEKVIQHR